MHALALAMVLAHSLVLNATVDVNCLQPVTVLRLHLGLKLVVSLVQGGIALLGGCRCLQVLSRADLGQDLVPVWSDLGHALLTIWHVVKTDLSIQDGLQLCLSHHGQSVVSLV